MQKKVELLSHGVCEFKTLVENAKLLFRLVLSDLNSYQQLMSYLFTYFPNHTWDCQICCFNLHFLLTTAAEHPVFRGFLGFTFGNLLVTTTVHLHLSCMAFAKSQMWVNFILQKLTTCYISCSPSLIPREMQFSQKAFLGAAGWLRSLERSAPNTELADSIPTWVSEMCPLQLD